jgi:hypothetical protein
VRRPAASRPEEKGPAAAVGELATHYANLAPARVEKAIAQGVAMFKAEQAQTEKAIAAFASLAERLDALAAARSRPWRRRLAG